MLSVRSVSKRYGKALSLDNVSFDLAPGNVLAVIGGNGAGKTTLIKCIVGLVHFDGEVKVNGIDAAQNGKAARRLIGYLPQSSTMPPDMSVQETAVFYAQLKGLPVERAREAVESAGLLAHSTKNVSELSGGMNQRLGLALALLADPPILILDEPAAGLDVAARLELRRLIQEQRAAGKSIVLSTHWLEDVPYVADEALLLDRGRTVFQGGAMRLAANDATASRLFLRLNGNTGQATSLVRATPSIRSVEESGDWLVISCPAPAKASVIEAVVGAGISILDFRVEEAPVGDAVSRMSELSTPAAAEVTE